MKETHKHLNFDFEQDIVLEDTRIRLSPLLPEHVTDLLPIAEKQPDLLRFSPSPFGTKENLQHYVEKALKGRKHEQRYPFIIFDKHSEQFAGSTSFGNISNENQRLEIGWTWIAKIFQRTGLNRHGKFLMLRYAFETLQFERVELKTDSRNVQSRRAMEAIGAVYEGELRSHTIMPDGFRRNTVYYSILKEDWPRIRRTVFKNFD